MNAVQFASRDKKLALVQVPTPVISHPREVLVKVAYSGVCGTDLHIISGNFPCNPLPLTLGHEFSATVVDFGSEVTHLTRGDRVVVDPNSGCHKCGFCHSGRPHFCTTGGFYANLGVKNHGGWAQFCLCSVEQVHKLPKEISLRVAALAEPLSCLAHGWGLISPVPVGANILVAGAGIIGTLWVCLLHLHGHRRVTLTEINPSRRLLLKELMDDTGFQLKTPQDVQNSGANFDLIIDCTGHGPAIESALKLLDRGGKICIFGVAPPGAKIEVSPFEVYMKELTILSVKVNPFAFPKAVALVQALSEKYLDYEKLGVKVFELEDFPRAVELLKTGNITKAIFQISE
ncbi:hypothetical protein MTP99_005694 [Tenebrio molitor]|jgi:D-arabinitol dehydrogenase (NADP+)|nr:hypothetical protein MTP99_005694 [Tenebrio molitor]CAH1381759.1 unnamed protein product [Tenebrio molitor]